MEKRRTALKTAREQYQKAFDGLMEKVKSAQKS
jgi:hypothetical protein